MFDFAQNPELKFEKSIFYPNFTRVKEMDTGKDQNTDKELIIKLKAGDRAAFREIFMLFERKLYYFVFSITKSEYISEEIIQEVFIKVWEQRENLDPDRSFDSFIYTMTRNLTYNYLRDASRRKAIREELWGNITLQSQEFESGIIFEEYKEIVAEIVRNLPPQKRSIYELSRMQGKSNGEIAELLGISKKTVKNHLWKTMATIRSKLKPYLEDGIKVLILLLLLG